MIRHERKQVKFLSSGNCTVEALITADIYGGLVFYGFYDIFFFVFIIVLGTVTVFYRFGNTSTAAWCSTASMTSSSSGS